jgi:hypothetical protein
MDRLEDSITVLREALELNAGDKELNYRYAMLPEHRNNPNYEDIKYSLRRSFTKGDSRFQSQLWYGRSLFLTNDFPGAREVFQTLSQVNADPEIKRKPVGIIQKMVVQLFLKG